MYEEFFHLHAQLLKALAHPRRLEIIHLLKEGSVTVGGMQEMLGLPQANLSQHLKILRDAGAVTQERNGKHITYRLAHKNFTKASEAMRDVLIERSQGKKSDEFTRRMKDLTPIVKDPVCGMRVSPKTAGAAFAYKGVRYYFCAAGCKTQFRRNVQRYV
ncbi:MAG: metalloregulator ArsR/SmtB family transcription factor [Patescibacteria group bacterium]|jgi:ArsR family transcriptional regulator